MKKFRCWFMIFIFTCCFVYNTKAERELRSSECKIVGIIKSVEHRKEPYEQNDWRVSWALPEFVEYVDVKINVVSSKMISAGEIKEQKACDISFFNKSTFQLRDDIDEKNINVKDCISAVTQYSGDEFDVGQWLYDITVLDNKECSNKD